MDEDSCDAILNENRVEIEYVAFSRDRGGAMMKYVYLVLLSVVVLLSFAAGGAKVTLSPQEVQFFESVGLGVFMVVGMGVLQLLGGVFAIPPTTRRVGTAVIAVCFLASSIIVFMAGNTAFGVYSLLPFIAASYVALRY
jgi:hypothetical protein